MSSTLKVQRMRIQQDLEHVQARSEFPSKHGLLTHRDNVILCAGSIQVQFKYEGSTLK